MTLLGGPTVAFAQGDTALSVDALRASQEQIVTEMKGVAQRQKVDLLLVEAADALGMWRSVGRAETIRAIQTFEYVGAGTMWTPARSGAWAPTKLTRYTESLDYFTKSRRLDVEAAGPDGKPVRTIKVASGAAAWTESPEPGLGLTPVAGMADYWRHFIWITPHGALRAAIDADPKTVKITTNKAGRKVIALAVDGRPLTIVLNADLRPETVTTTIKDPVLGEKSLEVAYSDYKPDDSLVYAPRKIVRKLGGKTDLDLDVSQVLQNPYMIFPPPGRH